MGYHLHWWTRIHSLRKASIIKSPKKALIYQLCSLQHITEASWTLFASLDSPTYSYRQKWSNYKTSKTQRARRTRGASLPRLTATDLKEPICLPAQALSQMLVSGMFSHLFSQPSAKGKKNGLLIPATQRWDLRSPRMRDFLSNLVFSCRGNDQLHFLSQELMMRVTDGQEVPHPGNTFQGKVLRVNSPHHFWTPSGLIGSSQKVPAFWELRLGEPWFPQIFILFTCNPKKEDF